MLKIFSANLLAIKIMKAIYCVLQKTRLMWQRSFPPTSKLLKVKFTFSRRTHCQLLNIQDTITPNPVSNLFLPGAKTEDLILHLIPYFNKKTDNFIIHIGTNDGRHNSETNIYEEISKIKKVIKTHHLDCKNWMEELMNCICIAMVYISV